MMITWCCPCRDEATARHWKVVSVARFRPQYRPRSAWPFKGRPLRRRGPLTAYSHIFLRRLYIATFYGWVECAQRCILPSQPWQVFRQQPSSLYGQFTFPDADQTSNAAIPVYDLLKSDGITRYNISPLGIARACPQWDFKGLPQFCP